MLKIWYDLITLFSKTKVSQSFEGESPLLMPDISDAHQDSGHFWSLHSPGWESKFLHLGVQSSLDVLSVEEILDGVKISNPDWVQGQSLHEHDSIFLVSFVQVPYSICWVTPNLFIKKEMVKMSHDWQTKSRRRESFKLWQWVIKKEPSNDKTKDYCDNHLRSPTIHSLRCWLAD